MEDSNDMENLANDENKFESDEDDDMEENEREDADDLNLYDFGNVVHDVKVSELTVEARQRCEDLNNVMRNFGSIFEKINNGVVDDAFFVGSGYDYCKSLDNRLESYGIKVGEDLHGLLINESNPLMINRGPIDKCYTFFKPGEFPLVILAGSNADEHNLILKESEEKLLNAGYQRVPYILCNCDDSLPESFWNQLGGNNNNNSSDDDHHQQQQQIMMSIDDDTNNTTTDDTIKLPDIPFISNYKTPLELVEFIEEGKLNNKTYHPAPLYWTTDIRQNANWTSNDNEHFNNCVREYIYVRFINSAILIKNAPNLQKKTWRDETSAWRKNTGHQDIVNNRKTFLDIAKELYLNK